MKYLVVYDSYFGNTEQIAKEVASVLDDCECVRVTDINFREKVDLLIVGSPTRGFKGTASIHKFLNSLPSNVKKVALFDTRIDLGTISSGFTRWMVGSMGYANNKMIKIVLKKKRKIVEPVEFFYVLDNEGPLKDGEIEKARRWAESLKIEKEN
jgi:flavodoxin